MQVAAKPAAGTVTRAAVKVRWVLAALLAACAACLGYQVYYVVLGKNLHEVVPGEIYRSAQLSGSDLRDAVAKYKIKTVVNLRGCCPETGWYQDEKAALKDLNVKKYDITFSSYVWPSIPELQQLIEALKTSEGPILLHCRRGADRTGMASAAALLLRSDADLREARKQLSWWYGHVSFSKTNVHDRVFDMYEDWLTNERRPHSPESFYFWAMERYRPGQCWAEIEPLDVPRRLPFGRPASARFRVYNRSVGTWHFKQNLNCGVHLHFSLLTASGKGTETGGAGYFDAEVPPGESIDLAIAIPPIRVPGRYQLVVDMADEECCWFSLVGSMPFTMEVEVDDAPAK